MSLEEGLVFFQDFPFLNASKFEAFHGQEE
jgi:hypothetical protein